MGNTGATTVSFSVRLAFKPEALAVIVQPEEQDCAGIVGIPLTVAVPSPLSVNVMPGGKAFAPAVMVVPGPPLVTTVMVVDCPCVNVKFVLEVGKINCKPVVGLTAASPEVVDTFDAGKLTRLFDAETPLLALAAG